MVGILQLGVLIKNNEINLPVENILLGVNIYCYIEIKYTNLTVLLLRLSKPVFLSKTLSTHKLIL